MLAFDPAQHNLAITVPPFFTSLAFSVVYRREGLARFQAPKRNKLYKYFWLYTTLGF